MAFVLQAVAQVFRMAQFLTYGFLNFGHRGYRANACQFTPDALDIDLHGRHIIVTGATSGLGRVAAETLASKNATVHLVCRDGSRGHAMQAAILRADAAARVHVHQCDMSSLKQVVRLAEYFTSKCVPVKALVNNAGCMIHAHRVSEDGFEQSFATNVLGLFVLTELLRPLLQAQGDARVVTVSSAGMLTEPLCVDDVQGASLTDASGRIDGARQYARCKRMQVAMTEFWAREYCTGGVFWCSVHPGWADTPGLQKSMPDFYRLTQQQLRSEQQGADSIVYLTIAEEVSSLNSGEFFFDRKPAVKHLWLAGTHYGLAEVARMMKGFRALVLEKGFSLPE